MRLKVEGLRLVITTAHTRFIGMRRIIFKIIIKCLIIELKAYK